MYLANLHTVLVNMVGGLFMHTAHAPRILQTVPEWQHICFNFRCRLVVELSFGSTELCLNVFGIDFDIWSRHCQST